MTDWYVARMAAIPGGEIARMLSGEVAYDDVAAGEQAVARAAWRQHIRERAAAVDVSDELSAAGRPWPEADADGNVVMRGHGERSGSADSAGFEARARRRYADSDR